jgi:hypothetical protein
MTLSIENVLEFSREYCVPETDIILMGLNLSGFTYNKGVMARGRFKLTPNGENLPFFIAASVDFSSQYVHRGTDIVFSEKSIGNATSPEEDTCSETYYRNNMHALTLNSNTRSNCTGCSFCGTYTLKHDDEKMNTLDRLLRKASELSAQRSEKNLSGIESIGVVTGCFNSENEAVAHLLNIKRAFSEYGFSGEINYIGSQIRSQNAVETLAGSGKFGLYLTVECFDRREALMKKNKADFSLEKGRELLEFAKKCGLETTFLYILGLDPVDRIKEEFPKYSESITRHPIVNLMQNYVPEHDSLRDESAHDISYYINARKAIEHVFIDTPLRPRLWENYRAPWATQYGGEALVCQRI